MKIFKFMIFALVAMGLTMACQEEETEKEVIQGGPAEVNITIKDGTNSRAEGDPIEGTPDESKILGVEFFVYNENGTKDAEYPYYLSTKVTGTHTFLVSEGYNKKFLVAINQNLGANAVKDTYDEMLEIIASKLLFESTTSHSQTAIDTDNVGYAMAGQHKGDVLKTSSNRIDITLYRLLSRVRTPKVKGDTDELGSGDIFKSVPESKKKEYYEEIFGSDYTDLGGDAPENLTWKFTGFVLINGIDRSYIFEEMDPWAPRGRNYFKTQYQNDGATIEHVYGGATGTDKFLKPKHTGEIFIYENRPSIVQGSAGEPTLFVSDEVTAFLIKGEFSAANINRGTPVTRYWRVNMIKDDTWEIFRNTVYEIMLNSINTPGFDTPKKAEEENPIVDPDDSSISIDLNVAKWGYKTQEANL